MLIAYGGIITGLILVSLICGTYISINTLSFICLASFFVGVMQIEGGTKYSLMCYFASSVLSFILPVKKEVAIAFFIFFGYYSIVKFYIEKINKLYIELVIKGILFSIVSFFVVNMGNSIFAFKWSEKIPYIGIVITGIILLYLYDFILNFLFGFYTDKVRRKIKRK